nr:MAG TPA: hypothetical protein [Caudoviricetes sp.]
MAKTQAEVRAAKDAKLGVNRDIQTAKKTTKYNSAPSNIEEQRDRKDEALGITRREGSTWNTGKTYTKPTAQSLLDQYNANAKKRIEEADAATQKAKKEYDYYIAKEGRIYQKNYGAPSDKANELQNKLNQARLAQRDAENEATITRLAQTSTLYKDNKNKKSKVDIGRTTELSTGIRAKEGNLTWDTDTYKAMTDEEVSVYNRLAKNGKGKEAEAFLKAITPTLNARVTKSRLESAQKTAQDGVMGGVGASIASSLLKPVTAAQGGIQTVYNFLTGKPIDTNAPEYYASNLANTLRSSVAEKIENGVYESTKGDYTYDRTGNRRMTTEGEAKNNGKIASFLYQTGMSMADMLTMTPFGPVGMQVMMSSNAGVDTMIDAKNNGATDDQAMALGIVSGAAEALFEKFSIENLFHGGVSKSTILAALKQGGIEASEEMATELTNILANEAIMGSQSDFNKAVAEYKEMGLDDKDAKAKALEEKLLQVLEAGAGGFLSGFGMGAAADIMNTRTAGHSVIDQAMETYINQGQTPEQARQSAIDYLKGELRAVGALADENSVAYKLSQKKGDMSTGDVGRAYIANTEQAENIVTNRLANTADTGYNINRGEINGAENGSQAQAGGNAGVSGETVTVSDSGMAQGLPGMDGRTDYRGIGEHLKQQLTNNGSTPIELRTEHDPSSFYAKIGEAKESNPYGAFVTQHEIEDYAKMRTFLNDDGTVGVAVKNDGDIVSVFKNKKNESKDAVSSILLTALENGGAKLDNYNGKLSRMYLAHGFIPVARTAFVDEYAPSDWNYERDGRPDIIFWAHNGDNADLTARNIGTQEMPDLTALPLMEYDEAAKYRDSLIPSKRLERLEQRLSEQPMILSREGIDIQNQINEIKAQQQTIADIANDTSRTRQQADLSEAELDFAKKLSQTAQNLGVVNSETKALGKEFFSHSEEMPSLQSIQNKNVEDLTSEDYVTIVKNLVGGGKQRLYTKETSRVFDTVAGGNKELRNTLYNIFEKPFNEAGGHYGKSLTSSVESYKEIMRKYGIKPKSKEDVAAQWYGEGQRRGPDGVMSEYTQADLQRDFPDTWEKIKGFAEANRQIYEKYLDRINSMMETIYPNVLENAQEEYQNLVSKLDVAKSKTDAMARAIAEKERVTQQLQDMRDSKQRRDTKAFANIEGRIAAEQAKIDSMKKELAELEKRQRIHEMDAQAQKTAIDTGAIYEGKRILPRKDYFHHAQEMLSDYTVLDFLKPKNVNEDISPALAGISDQTKPKSRWWGAMFHRGNGAYFASASNAMASYIGMAEYKLAYDPLTNYFRKMEGAMRTSADTVNAKNASGFIEWTKDWTDGIAGKSDHVIDRGVQKAIGRQMLNSINNVNKRVRANKVMGNIRTMVVQGSNLANATGYIPSAKAWQQGLQAFVDYHFNPDSNMRQLLSQSEFMSQRYGANGMNILEGDGKGVKWLAAQGLELLQHWGDDLTWFSAYSQFNNNPDAAMSGMKRRYENAIDYADDITRRSVAGRGVGEGALLNNSKVINTLVPFQTEVLNQWNAFFEHAKDLKASPEARKRAAKGLASLEVSTYLFNLITETLIGDKILGFDFINAIVEAIQNYRDDDDEDKNALDLAKGVAQSSLGTMVDAAPYANIIANLLDKETNEKIFGKEHSPTRYGGGNIGLQAAADGILWGLDTAEKIIDGISDKTPAEDVIKSLDWEGGLDAVGNFVTPWGGTQLARTAKGLETFIRGGKYDKEGNLQYAVAKTPVNFLRAATLGRSVLPEHREWVAKGFPTLTPEQTKAYGEFKKAGGNITAFTDFKAEYDELKNSIGADNREISKLADEIEAANPMLSEAQAKERAQNQLGKKYRNADNEYLTLVADSDMTDEQKLAAMMAIGMSDDDINKVKGLVKNGVTVGEYLKYQNLYSSRGSTKTEDKNALVSALMADKTLSEKDKTMLANRIIDGDWVVDFSSQAANDILTQHGKSSYNKYQKAKTEAGISAETYLSYANKSDNFISDYDQYGTSISYSKKAKVVDYLEKIDASEEQKEYMFHELFGYTSSYQARFKKLKEIDGVWCYEHNGEWIRPTY